MIRAALIVALLIALPNEPFLHLLSHPKVRVRHFWNRYDHTRLGIAGSVSFANLNRKHSESAQLDAITAHQRSGNFVDDSMDDFLDVLTVRGWVLVPYAPNEIGLDHAELLQCYLAGGKKCSALGALFNG
jgi:hypothetical protein